MNEPKTQNLTMALRGIIRSIIIIYAEFRPYFKILALVIVCVAAYKLGKYSSAEPIAKKLSSLSSSIKVKQSIQEGGPILIATFNKRIYRFTVLLVVIILMIIVMTLMKEIVISPIYYALMVIVAVVIYGYLFMRRKILLQKQKQLPSKEKKIKQDIKILTEMLGKKVQNNLRTTLCRDKILSHSKIPTNICTKKQCKQLRQNLRMRYEGIRNLAQAALIFEWCSVCRKRLPFDEFLAYEMSEMPQMIDKSEQQEVQCRIQYLMHQCQQMMKWIKDVGPCNCSKLYIEEIIKHKKIFIQIDRSASETIQKLQKIRN